jgi:transcriptional regulator with XRE-family HTH domain
MVKEIKERIGKQVVDRLDSGEAGLCYKKELAEKAGVSLTTVFAIIGNKSDYTFESLLKVYLALDIETIELWPQE